MRFVFDQHVNARALKQLQTQGVDVVHVAEVGPSEADDPEIFARAAGEGRIVVSAAGGRRASRSLDPRMDSGRSSGRA